MTTHSSATARQATSHVNRTTRTATIMNALKQRAQAVLNDESLDDQSRAILRHALETNDPWLAELVRREDPNEDDSSRRKVEALAEIIFGAVIKVLAGYRRSDPRSSAKIRGLPYFPLQNCYWD